MCQLRQTQFLILIYLIENHTVCCPPDYIGLGRFHHYHWWSSETTCWWTKKTSLNLYLMNNMYNLDFRPSINKNGLSVQNFCTMYLHNRSTVIKVCFLQLLPKTQGTCGTRHLLLTEQWKTMTVDIGLFFIWKRKKYTHYNQPKVSPEVW